MVTRFDNIVCANLTNEICVVQFPRDGYICQMNNYNQNHKLWPKWSKTHKNNETFYRPHWSYFQNNYLCLNQILNLSFIINWNHFDLKNKLFFVFFRFEKSLSILLHVHNFHEGSMGRRENSGSFWTRIPSTSSWRIRKRYDLTVKLIFLSLKLNCNKHLLCYGCVCSNALRFQSANVDCSNHYDRVP